MRGLSEAVGREAMARLNAPPGGRDGACKASDVGRPGGAGVAKRLRGQGPLKKGRLPEFESRPSRHLEPTRRDQNSHTKFWGKRQFWAFSRLPPSGLGIESFFGVFDPGGEGSEADKGAEPPRRSGRPSGRLRRRTSSPAC